MGPSKFTLRTVAYYNNLKKKENEKNEENVTRRMFAEMHVLYYYQYVCHICVCVSLLAQEAGQDVLFGCESVVSSPKYTVGQ